MWGLRLTVFVLIVSGAICQADPLDEVESWAKAQKINALSAVLQRDGVTRAAREAEQPIDLASNSKAITALCVKTLVDAGALRWDMTLTEALGRTAPSATLAEIVTHVGGIGPDSTQVGMRKWLNDPTPRHGEVTATVLGRSEQHETHGTYAYNNENYAVLAQVIETASGVAYAPYCQDKVMRPVGVRAELSPRFGAFAAWGGWRMSMGDYARLHWYYFGPQSDIGRDPLAYPHAELAEGVYYGLGMIHRRDERGWISAHAGALRFFLGPQTGSYAVIFPDGTQAAVGYDRGLTGGDVLRALDRAVRSAIDSR